MVLRLRPALPFPPLAILLTESKDATAGDGDDDGEDEDTDQTCNEEESPPIPGNEILEESIDARDQAFIPVSIPRDRHQK